MATNNKNNGAELTLFGQSLRDEMASYREEIIKAKFSSTSTTEKEIIDIANDYYWIQNKPRLNINNVDIPFIYATEYRQMYSSTITNIINSIYWVTNALQQGGTYLGKTAKSIRKYFTDASDTKDRVDEASQRFDQIIADGELSNGEVNDFYKSFELMNSYDRYATPEHTIRRLFGDSIYGIESVGNTVGEWLSKAGNWVGGTWVGDISSRIYNQIKDEAQGISVYGDANPHLKTKLLCPYSLLYSLKPTEKKYSFPYYTSQSASWFNSNAFGAASGGYLAKGFYNPIASNLLPAVGGTLQEVEDVSRLFSKGEVFGRGFSMYNIETAKAFNFPADGKEIEVKFPLFNTLRVNEWKKNYIFIVLFGIRNMLFRHDNVEYSPPLFYDLSTAGFGRWPICYVQSFSVVPSGMIRMMKLDSLPIKNPSTGKVQTEIAVNVPDAWIVSIKFKSLIADSANLYLSSMFDLPIKASVKNS